MAARDYSDLSENNAKEIKHRKVQQQKVTGLSIAALVVGILSIPAAMMPVIGIVAAVVALAVALIALFVAIRGNQQKVYAAIGVLLAIIAVCTSIVITNFSSEAARKCEEEGHASHELCQRLNS
ncbi:DUF308 domain-containing protein [Corynebacterium auriscanis]|uniref:DUF308 domain-containing protein n=1 Tax=Corynebacterium auriscanis TaxID=99807 RepID=UPI003CE7EA4C